MRVSSLSTEVERSEAKRRASGLTGRLYHNSLAVKKTRDGGLSVREALLVSRASTLVCGDDDLADRTDGRTDGRLVSLSIVGRVSFLVVPSA